MSKLTEVEVTFPPNHVLSSVTRKKPARIKVERIVEDAEAIDLTELQPRDLIFNYYVDGKLVLTIDGDENSRLLNALNAATW